MSNIFLSHSSKDGAIAKEVKDRLVQWGHRSVFLDFDPEHGIPAGRDWEKELYAKLRECRAVIVLCSHASMASRWCFAEVTYARAQGKPVISIRIDQVQLDYILTKDQVIDATGDWEHAYQRLQNGLLAAGLDPKDAFDWDTKRSPYPGLLALQEKDAAVFFGRDKEIREGLALLNRIRDFGGPRITLMLGASGSGKSSLMRAGLLPRLKRDVRWVVIDPFRPLKTPFNELARVLSERFSHVMEIQQGTPTDETHVRDRIGWGENDTKQSAEPFLRLLKELREKTGSRETTVLLMIDQCEELLAIGGANEEGDRFLAFLRAVLDCEDSGLMLLATVRSDFLGSFHDYPVLRGARFNTIQVPQMGVDDFASLIEGPARLAGLDLGPGLVQAMIHDTETSDALPLLAFTLRQLYEGYGDDGLLTLEEYRVQLGGLDGCIARAAEAVLSAKLLSENERLDLQTALLSMVRVNDRGQYAKQPARWRDMPDSIHELLERFVIARLMISSYDEHGRTLEVAHEALFRDWPRLADWLKNNRSFLVWQERLRGVVRLYQNSNGKPDFLLRGFPLTEALEWLRKKSDSFSPDEAQFVMASQTQTVRRRMVTATLVGLVFLLIGGIIWLWQKGYGVDHALLKAQSFFVSIHMEPRLEEMIVVKGGAFLQGDSRGNGESSERPARKVNIKRFAIGKYEVTFKEYDRFAIATGRDLPNDLTWGRGSRPVINVSWKDVKDYAAWLSEKTGKRYRLPTESEWEYAARSEGKDDIWAGTSDKTRLSEYVVYADNSNEQTAHVFSKEPNGLGLHHMSGNVFEWVEDCYHEDYSAAPIDGTAWLKQDGGDCNQRVFRGGAWSVGSKHLRVSFRVGRLAALRNNVLGFRLARDVDD